MYAQLQPFTLAGSGASAAATSVTVTSALDIDGNAITMSDAFGTKGFATLEPGNSSQEEQISFTGLTNNSNGTTTFTGVSSVGFLSPYTETSGLAKSHPGGSKFIISNTSGFYNELVSKDDDETINGLYTFAQFPQKSGVTTPTIAAELASKAYVDSVAGGIATTNQILVGSTSGEALTAGYVVYKKAADGKWYIAKANDTTTFYQLELGIAQSTVAINTSVNILVRGVDSNQSGITAGSSYYITDAGGLPSTTPGTNNVFVGYGQTATSILVDFRSIDIPYHPEKQALIGSAGAPSSSNKYVTQADVSSANTAALIVRANTSPQGGGQLPALDAVKLHSVSITALYTVSQTGGDIIVKKTGVGWTNVHSSVNKVLIGTAVAPGLAFQSVPRYSSVVTSRAGDTASGSVSVAHNLGFTPRITRVIARKLLGAAIIVSDGYYIGTSTTCVYGAGNSGGGGIANTSTTNVLNIFDDSGGNNQVATVTVDGTNVNFTFTKSGSPSAASIFILIQTEA